MKVSYSQWVAPIVCIPKNDGRVCIRGNYNVMMNGFLDVDQSPLSHPEDIFATLAGGRKALHSSGSFQCLQSGTSKEESQELITINTH